MWRKSPPLRCTQNVCLRSLLCEKQFLMALFLEKYECIRYRLYKYFPPNLVGALIWLLGSLAKKERKFGDLPDPAPVA